MTRSDIIALIFSIAAVIIASIVSTRVFDGIPHIEDEFTYVWQAQVITAGEIKIESPRNPKEFLVPFVVDYQGSRFGKYPLGWPVVLSFGIRLGIRHLVNPILSGLAVWFIYRLAKKIFGPLVGLLSAGLLLSSPFFLLNAGSLLSHPWGLLLSIFFTIAWIDIVKGENQIPAWLKIAVAGLSLGLLALSRPFTMLGIAIPFGIQGVFLLIRGDHVLRKRILWVGIIMLLLASFHFVWQYSLSGDAFLNPYTLWWEYDKVGFGPGYGVTESGHNLEKAWFNTRFSLLTGMSDLFGWGRLSWIFLPVGLWAIRKKREFWPVAGTFPTLILIYLAYWVGSWLFGPRYYFESIYSLVILTAVGIAWLGAWWRESGVSTIKIPRLKKIRSLATTALLLLLLSINLIFYLPGRLSLMRNLYGIGYHRLEPFLADGVEQLAPVLVLVHADKWMEYGAYLELSGPNLDTPFIFAWCPRNCDSNQMQVDYPDRRLYHYYPEDRLRLYSFLKDLEN